MIILNKRHLNSANIQAEFYLRCRIRKFPCILEYKYDNCRFDAVIHNHLYVIAIIEIKNHKRPKRFRQTIQLTKYQSFNIPVFLIKCHKDIHTVIEEIDMLIKNQKQL